MDLSLEKHPEQRLQAKRYSTWQLIKLYWQSKEKASAYGFAAVMIVMTIVMVGFDVVFNYWYNYFYNSLQAYQVGTAVKLLALFFGLAALYIIVGVYRYYLSQLFALRWRRWLTQQLIGRWLKEKGYYYLETFDGKTTDNPDQRIQDDVNGLITNTISLTLGLVGAITTFPAFVYILWTLSGVFTVPLGPLGTVHIYGYLVWVGLLYNLIGTLIIFKIGRPLVNLNFEQQRLEATFRFSAIDLRSHAEQIALYRGEEHQKGILDKHFFKVLQNWYAIVLRQKLLLWFTLGFNQTALLLPFMAALPNYFNRVFLLGGLMQSIRAFTNVQESLSYLINAYTQIAEWRAISRRLTSFLRNLNEAETSAQQAANVTFKHGPEDAIAVKDLTISTNHNEVLLENMNEHFIHGKNYVIKGESGIGKSTFIRTLAQVWPFAAGEVTVPANKHMMYVPQKLYMPMGTLAEAILFPDKADPNLESQLAQALQDCHLEKWAARLNDTERWSEQLSPGEQQRIAFARVLLHKPDWVFLDESTSMLDLANEAHLYRLLQERLPHCSIISVGHRSSVDAFHQQTINLEKYSHQPSGLLTTHEEPLVSGGVND